MSIEMVEVIDQEKVGKRGYPRHYHALGIDPPTKIAPALPETQATQEPAQADPYTPSAPTEADVIAERQRRLAEGFDFDFGGSRGIHHIGTTAEDLSGWDEVTKIASALLAVGKPDEPIAIVTATGPATVTAIEWQHVLLAAAAFRQPIFAASFALHAMTPIPDDFADDRHWPSD